MQTTCLKVHRSNFLYRSKEYPFMMADVDRLVTGEDAGLECKTASLYQADKWADGKVPLYYAIQCYHYMAVTGKRTWYIACMISLPEAYLGRRFDRADHPGRKRVLGRAYPSGGRQRGPGTSVGRHRTGSKRYTAQRRRAPFLSCM